MDSILLLNNLSSLTASLACWWLAHTYAAAGFPYGRIIASLWAILGMSMMLTAFARNLYIDPSPFLVLSKVVLTALCLAIARRVTLNTRMLRKAERSQPTT